MTITDDAIPMRRDRDGDLYPDIDAPDPHLHLCHRGWLAPAPDGTPVPCLICKPHLIRRHLRRYTDPATAERRRHLVRQALAAAARAPRAAG